MRTENVIWGLVLLFVGGIMLLNNFGVIDFSWGAIWQFWPVILILAGANMLFSRSHSAAGAALAVVATVCVLAFVAYQGLTNKYRSPLWFRYEDNGNWNDNDTLRKSTHQTFAEPFDVQVKRAELTVTGGASDYKLKDTTTDLFKADVKQHIGNYSLQRTSRDSLEILEFRMQGKNHNWNMSDMDENNVTMLLNTDPLWNINLKLGAGEAELDLRPFKVENITIKGGAASFELKLGMPQTVTNITAETGMAEVKVSVPKEAGCQIWVKTGISSRDFDGFTKQADGSYTTANYASATKKIIIRLKGGLSDYEIERY
ncbi:hypothetical protein FW774_11995 [Pedobacter sp. BS3]|uniref:LiaI-LiaF-like domain-containing protein n=1 Tax=Pedobacter sp. BS3 TaxID=2567937 RepID=UPI0011EE2FED|nr:DUF5668 domain-containing protein [Pedobacter sp. BS3]TZF83020.1 hypothetical protein FW774_11995 [Pedobacter sp. BS3]